MNESNATDTRNLPAGDDREAQSTDHSNRAAAYRFLSRLWISEVDAEMFRQFAIDGEMQSAFLAAGGNLTELQNEAVGVDELSEDYCQLFLGPANHLPPYQSVWIDGQFAGDYAVQMKQWCEIAQVQLDAVQPDHLGVQLAVMANLVGANQPVVESDFRQQHLSWSRRLTDLASQRARTEFYRSVMQMTQAFLAEEQTP